jgi:hypothetical protein
MVGDSVSGFSWPNSHADWILFHELSPFGTSWQGLVIFVTWGLKMLNRPKKLIAAQKFCCNFFPQSALCPSHIWKNKLGDTWERCALITFHVTFHVTIHVMNGSKGTNMPSDMLHTPNTHNMSKTCIPWTQNMIRCHRVKTNGAKGMGRKWKQYFLYQLQFPWQI